MKHTHSYQKHNGEDDPLQYTAVIWNCTAAQKQIHFFRTPCILQEIIGLLVAAREIYVLPHSLLYVSQHFVKR